MRDDNVKYEHGQQQDGITGDFCTETVTYYQASSSSSSNSTSDSSNLQPLHVQVESATTTRGGDIVSSDHDATGIMIWPATHLLCQHVAGGDLQQMGEHVVELGCGVGLVGITAMKASRSSDSSLTWVSTDMDQRALQLCQRNYKLNNVQTNDKDSKVWTQSLFWGDKQRANELLDELRERVDDGESRFDSVVGADIVYPSTCGKILDSLFQSVDALLKPTGIFWLSFCTRDGAVTPSRLIEAASQAGFRITALEPLDAALAKLLPPLLDSRILIMRRCPDAEKHNNELGKSDCSVFPRLQEKLARLEESSSEEEWAGPPLDSDDDNM